jgi:hypothetical protein
MLLLLLLQAEGQMTCCRQTTAAAMHSRGSLVAVDGLAASAVVICEVPALQQHA